MGSGKVNFCEPSNLNHHLSPESSHVKPIIPRQLSSLSAESSYFDQVAFVAEPQQTAAVLRFQLTSADSIPSIQEYKPQYLETLTGMELDHKVVPERDASSNIIVRHCNLHVHHCGGEIRVHEIFAVFSSSE